MPKHLLKTLDRDRIEARSPLPVVNEEMSSRNLTISSETVTFADGAAGTTQQIKLANSNILSENGERIGGFITDKLAAAAIQNTADTSLSFTTGTVLTTEVPWTYGANEENDNDTARLAGMSDGEYMVNYEQGFILGKNAITTSTTTDTVGYKIKTAIIRSDSEIIRTIVDGRKTITTTGTAEALVASSTTFNTLEIQALVGNTDYIMVGTSTVVATSGSERGIKLSQGMTRVFYGGDLANIYLNGISGDGLSYIYTT